MSQKFSSLDKIPPEDEGYSRLQDEEGSCLPGREVTEKERCSFVKVDPVYGTPGFNKDYIWNKQLKNIGTIQLMDFDWLKGDEKVFYGEKSTNERMDIAYIYDWYIYILKLIINCQPNLNIMMHKFLDEKDNWTPNGDKGMCFPIKNIMEFLLYGPDRFQEMEASNRLNLQIDKGNNAIYKDIWDRINPIKKTKEKLLKSDSDEIQRHKFRQG